EDGIRDRNVTGVQTCALPISKPMGMYSFLTGFFMIAGGIFGMHLGLSLHTKECTENTAEYLYTKPCGRQAIYKGKLLCTLAGVRSEERRVGKECRLARARE